MTDQGQSDDRDGDRQVEDAGLIDASGAVDPRLLRPDPGESRAAFEARVLAAVLGLDGPVPTAPRADDTADTGDAHATDDTAATDGTDGTGDGPEDQRSG